MKIWNKSRNGNPRRVFALALLIASAHSPWLHATDLAVSGNLSVSGTGVIQGSSLQLGTASGTPTSPGLIFTYADSTNQIGFSAPKAATTWIWQYNNSGTWESQMGLDATNTLTIYDRASTPNAAIVFNPTGTSTLAQSLTVNGTNNLLPNQTLTGTGSILTEGLADARYLTSSLIVATPTTDSYGSDNSYALLGSSAIGVRALAIGKNASSDGDTSIAIGFGATAIGGSAIALGENSYALESTSVAIGSWAYAKGQASYAFGYAASSDGYGSIAFEQFAYSPGYWSGAGGPATTAQGMSQFVVGQNNIPQGTGTSWVATDDLFIVGNGPATINAALVRGTSSNAFAVKKNGETSVFGAKLNFGLVSGVTPGAAGSTGASLLYADGTSGTVTFGAVKDASTWNWQENTGGTAKTQMSLNGSNVLTLYNSMGAAAIVLDPANPPILNGITQATANGLYASSAIYSGSAVTYGTTTYYEVSVGGGSATGGDAIAIGKKSQATGQAAAIGENATASGENSTAVGSNATATGIYSTANATSATASGNYSVASAVGALASGEYATAAGAQSTAAGFAQFVVGQYNDITTNPSSATAWVTTDDLFQIGNGTDATHTSNAFTVKKNGDTTINGTLTVPKLVVQHIDPQGDLAMGDFQNGM